MLTLEQTRRHARQIALPEVGADGQARIAAARVVIVSGGDAAARAAADYLRAGGVGRADLLAPPADPDGWQQALHGASLVLRFSFDDDPMLRTAIRLGIPVLVGAVRGAGVGVDLFAFRRHGPCPHVGQAMPVRPAAGAEDDSGAAAVVLATLAASEALQLLVDPQAPPRARLLRLALDGSPATAQDIPWAPECFRCGGNSPEASFA